MASIEYVCGYIPFLRIKGDEIRSQARVRGPAEKCVANYDEDPITLAYECGSKILERIEKNAGKIRMPVAIIFVSSSIDGEKNPAVNLLEALDLPPGSFATSISGGPNAIVDAIYIGKNLVEFGSYFYCIILTGEKRTGQTWDVDFGLSSAGGGILISKREDGGLFKIGKFHFILERTYDVSKIDGKIVAYDERFATSEEYLKLLRFIKYEGKIIFSAPTFGILTGIVRALKVNDDVINSFGCLGNAQIPVSLAYSTGILKAGEKLLAVGFGDGLKAVELIFEGDSSPYDEILRSFERKKYINFGHYFRIKDMEGFPEDEISVPMLWRERKQNLRFYGQMCGGCGNIQFPMQNYCIVCGSKDLKEEKLPKVGEIFTFTEDFLTQYSELEPPLPMLVVKLKNGARVYLQGVEFDSSPKIGDKVELTLRILNKSEGQKNYFYKARKISELSFDF